MKIFRICIVVIIMQAFTAGCTDRVSSETIASKRAEWDRVHPRNYSFIYIKECACEFAGELVTVTVHKENATGWIKKRGVVINDPMTIEELFELLILTQSDQDVVARATFDKDYSFPRKVEINNPNSIHRIVVYEIVEFSITAQ